MKKLISLIMLLIIVSNLCILPTHAAYPTYTCSEPYRSSVYYQNLSNVTLTGNHRSDLINVARSQIGYREGSCDADLSGWNDGSHSYNNYCEYNFWYYGGAHNGGGSYPWCATFVSWCARQANIPTNILKNSAAAGHSAAYFNIPYYSGSSYTPKPGDLFFTSSWSHVGIVESVNGDSFTTIEGNTNDNGSSNGNGVYNRVRYGLANYNFGTPAYLGNESIEPSPPVTITPPVNDEPETDILPPTVDVGTPKRCQVILDTNGGKRPATGNIHFWGSDGFYVDKDEYFTLPDKNPTKRGYIFLGWSTSKYASLPQYDAGERLKADGDVVFYAVWEKIEHNLSLTFDDHIVYTDRSETVIYRINGAPSVIDDVEVFGDYNIDFDYGIYSLNTRDYLEIELKKTGNIRDNEIEIVLFDDLGNIICEEIISVFNFQDRDTSGVSVYLNKEKVNFDVQPRIINNRTMVPMRAIFEALGADVFWDNDTRTITAKKDGSTIVATIGSKTMYVDRLKSEMDIAPVIIDGRTLVPVRFVALALDCDVDWLENLHVVDITG